MDLRLYVNAGMSFPACYAGAKLLDTSKAHLMVTALHEAVTLRQLPQNARIQARVSARGYLGREH